MYVLQKPRRIMWETPISAPMSVANSTRQSLGGFGEAGGSSSDFALGHLLVYGISLLMLGGVVIWVVRSVRKD